MKKETLLARASRQLNLLNVDPILNCHSNATARNAYGQAAQIIVCDVIGLSPIPINGNYPICFDAEASGVFYEIKSCGPGHKIVIYNWRLKKELEAGVYVNYAILIHSLRGIRTNVLQAMRDCKPKILILPLGCVKDVFDQHPTCYYNPRTPTQKRLGYARKGYKDGYKNIHLNQLLNVPTKQIINL